MASLGQTIESMAEKGKEKAKGVRENATMTRATGCPVAHMKHSLTAGPNGPVLLQDYELVEKLQHFDREKIPPRNVHALGNGAYGKLTVTNDISQYSKAKVFNVGSSTNIFVRFSGIFTELGEADTTRDPRGFAIKFYTEEGNWDLLAINTPVFNVRDAKLGPDAIHAFKRDPRTFEWNNEQVWDFVVNHPESLHQTLMLFSDRCGTPLSYRFMHGYGCNTFSLLNENNERFWVKFHILSHHESAGLSDQEAKILAGEDPDFLKRDLREAIERGDYPKWRFCMQVMPEAEGYKHPYTFDCTKAWHHDEYPLIDIGTLELNRNPLDYFSEVEQVAFSPANIVPGIGFSPDRLLQGRLLIYSDTQFHRLGPNYLQIPVNSPQGVNKVETNYTGGSHQMEVRNKWPHYYPNSFGGVKPEAKYMEPPLKCDGEAYYYEFDYKHGEDEDYYEQPRYLFQSCMSSTAKRHLIYNIAVSLRDCNEPVLGQVLSHLTKIDRQLGEGVQQERDNILSDKGVQTEGQAIYNKLHAQLQRNDPGACAEA